MNQKKVALVTGGNKGIGYEIARQLGKGGMTVVVGARDEARGRESAERLVAEGVDARAVRLDVTDPGGFRPRPPGSRPSSAGSTCW